MDSSKRPLGIIGMVYRDYAMLKRWYDYYAGQVGAENLFLFSHGNDPKHREIATGANVIAVPRDGEPVKFDARRWRMMSHVASGYLNYYNWMLVTDIDEIVVVDPNVAPALVDYLAATFPDITAAPTSLSPFGLCLMHVPEEEPLPLCDSAPILSRRRYVYASRVYSKPTLVRAPVMFGPGGHRNNLGPRALSDELYLLHLKFCDRPDPQDPTRAIYDDIRAKFTLGDEDIHLPEFRAQMRRQKAKYRSSYVWGPARATTLSQLPARFTGLV